MSGLDLEKLRGFVDELRGDTPKTPAELVFEKMSPCLTEGQNTMSVIRTELFLIDLIEVTEKAIEEVVKGQEGKSNEQLVVEVKDTEGFRGLKTNLDDTVAELISEAKIRLANHHFQLFHPSD